MTNPQSRPRLAGLFFLFAVGIGVFSEFGARGQLRVAGRLVALAFYLAVTVLFYQIFRPVNRTLALAAAVLAVALLAIAPFNWHPAGMDVGLVCFGVSWLLTAYLVFTSGLFPKAIGVIGAIAGLAWLTFLWRPLSQALNPYNLAVGIAGQVLFCLWLVTFGADNSGDFARD